MRARAIPTCPSQSWVAANSAAFRRDALPLLDFCLHRRHELSDGDRSVVVGPQGFGTEPPQRDRSFRAISSAGYLKGAA